MPDATMKPTDPQLFWKESYLRNMITSIFCAWLFLLIMHTSGITRVPIMQDVVDQVILPLKRFSIDSWRLFNRCSKPSRKEFTKIACATAIGFCLMGFLGFFVKLVHIPINNIIVS